MGAATSTSANTVPDECWKGDRLDSSSFPVSGTVTVDTSQLTDYVNAMAAGLSKGHERIQTDIVSFVTPDERAGDFSRTSDFPAYDIKSRARNEIVRYKIVITVEKTGDEITISHDAHSSLLENDYNIATGAPTEEGGFSPEQGASSTDMLAPGRHPMQQMARNLRTQHGPHSSGASSCSGATGPGRTHLPLSSLVPSNDPNNLEVVQRKAGKPMAKTPAKKLLPLWEEVDESTLLSVERAREQEEAKNVASTFNPFMEEDQTLQHANAYAEKRQRVSDGQLMTFAQLSAAMRSGMYASAEMEIRAFWDNPAQMRKVEAEQAQGIVYSDNRKALRSYEEEVLKIHKSGQVHHIGVLAEGDVSPLASMYSPATRKAKTAFNGDFTEQLELDVDAKTYAYKGTSQGPEKTAFERMMEDASFFEVPVASQSDWWSTAGDIQFPGSAGGPAHPVLRWTGKAYNQNVGPAIALCTDSDVRGAHVDAEVDLKITMGHAGGLVVRAPPPTSSSMPPASYWLLRYDSKRREVGFLEVNDLRPKLDVAQKVAMDDLRQGYSKTKEVGAEGYHYFKFVPLKMRGTEKKGETMVQLTRIQFRNQGVLVSLASAVATTPGGGTVKGYGPEKACDDSADYSIWVANMAQVDSDKHSRRRDVSAEDGSARVKLDPNRAAMVIQFEQRIVTDAFCFSTPKEKASRDPVQWLLSGSNDGCQWIPLHCMGVDYLTPLSSTTEWFPLDPTTRYIPELSREGTTTDWFHFRVRALGPSLSVFFEEDQIASVVDPHIPRPSCVGVWTTFSEDDLFPDDMPIRPPARNSEPMVTYRDFGIIALEDAWKTIEKQSMLLYEEQIRIEKYQRQRMQENQKVIKATKLISEVAKIKIKYIKQKMTRYEQATAEGRESKMRDQELLAWLCLLSVLAKFHDFLMDEKMQEVKNNKFLKQLEKDAPPPPPPPAEAPPSREDEELHYAYEAMKRRYEPQWTKAGKKQLGEEKFEAIRDKVDGPAEKEKGLISQTCLRRAMEVMSEREHQEYIKKAWCLENDWTPYTEADEKEVARWAREKAKQLQKDKKNSAGSSGNSASI